jgi:mono/diheme cytochrome c family protein
MLSCYSLTRYAITGRVCGVIALVQMGASIHAQSVFNQHVRPILEKQCQACHSGASNQSGLEVATREMLLRGGDHGPAVVPGKPEESLLYLYVKHERQPGMPFGGKKLTEEQIARIAEWIRAGAPFDEPLKTAAPAPGRAATDHWAFRAPVRPPVPAVKNANNPIDAFLIAAQNKMGLTALPETDKYTLLRRLFLDLAGIPPTRAQIRAFLPTAPIAPMRKLSTSFWQARSMASAGAATGWMSGVTATGTGAGPTRSATASGTSGSGATGSSNR